MDAHMDMLIQQELDGENSSEDSARLIEALSSDDALQARLEEYKLLATAIGNIPQAEPSANFTSGVMAALPRPQPARPQIPRFSLIDFLMGPRLRLVYASMAGMLIATAVTLSLVSGPIASTAGSMVTTPGAFFDVVNVGGVRVEAAEEAGSLVLTYQGESQLTFGYAAATHDVSGVTWSDDGVSVVSDPGQLSVTNMGQGTVQVAFSPANGAVIQIGVGAEVAATIRVPEE